VPPLLSHPLRRARNGRQLNDSSSSCPRLLLAALQLKAQTSRELVLFEQLHLLLCQRDQIPPAVSNTCQVIYTQAAVSHSVANVGCLSLPRNCKISLLCPEMHYFTRVRDHYGIYIGMLRESTLRT
jgi:hypothetical protein